MSPEDGGPRIDPVKVLLLVLFTFVLVELVVVFRTMPPSPAGGHTFLEACQ